MNRVFGWLCHIVYGVCTRAVPLNHRLVHLSDYSQYCFPENQTVIVAYYDMEDDVLTWNVPDMSVWKGSYIP